MVNTAPTAKITVNGSGTITAVKLMDGGSAYGVGDNDFVAGVAQTTGFSEAVVRVDSVYSNVRDTVKVIVFHLRDIQNLMIFTELLVSHQIELLMQYLLILM